MLRVDNYDEVFSFLPKTLSQGYKNTSDKYFSINLKPWLLTNDDGVVIGSGNAKFSVRGMIGLHTNSLSNERLIAEASAIVKGNFIVSRYTNAYRVYTTGPAEPCEAEYEDIYNYIKRSSVLSEKEIYDTFSSIKPISTAMKLSKEDEDVFCKVKREMIKDKLCEMNTKGYLKSYQTDIILEINLHTKIDEMLKPQVKSILIKYSDYNLYSHANFLRDVTKKPFGIHLRSEHNVDFDKLVCHLPDFFLVDSIGDAEILHRALALHGLRDKVRIILSQVSLSFDSMYQALISGVDLFILSLNNILNRYSVVNDVISLRQELFMMAEKNGYSSPIDLIKK